MKDRCACLCPLLIPNFAQHNCKSQQLTKSTHEPPCHPNVHFSGRLSDRSLFTSSRCSHRCALKTRKFTASRRLNIPFSLCFFFFWLVTIKTKAHFDWINSFLWITLRHKSSNLRWMEHLLLSRAFYPLVICPLSRGSLGHQLKECGRCPLSSSALLLPRCKMWWFLSPGTTCWRWDWAELLLFAPLAPGFHGSLFLTLQEWCDVIYRCKVTSRRFYRKIWDGHIYREERGGL